MDDVSGRGVGLDVVADLVGRIKGTVDMASEPGQGTVFSLRFPATLAQARVVMAEAAGSPVAIPAAGVRHVARLSDADVEQMGDHAFARLHGDVYPVASLARVLGLPQERPAADPPVIFVEANGRRAAWLAGSVAGQEEIVVRPLGTRLLAPRGVSGATLLQDGRVALLLHLPDLLDSTAAALRRPLSLQAQLPLAGVTATAAQPYTGAALRVLVVDDSPTIRKLLVRMLKDLGWLPIEAKDGEEALELIRVDKPDVVLADVEMPRLDGYGLLAALRRRPETAGLPVVMLTSRTAERHRQRAMELGATGYLTKPYRPQDVAAALREHAGQLAGAA